MPRYQGLLYRALSVKWQSQPLSGEGARLKGGRLNPVGQRCLYTSLAPDIAMREATQGIGGFQPTTIVSYEADIDNLIDLSSEDLADHHGVSWAAIIDPDWMKQQLAVGKSGSQLVGESIVTAGYNGLIIPSFASGAQPADRNIVLYNWGDSLPALISLVDDENRLGLKP